MGKQITDLPEITSVTDTDLLYLRRVSDNSDYRIPALDAFKQLQRDVLTNWTVVTASMTAAAGEQILADSSNGAFTVTLPASPSQGNRVSVRAVGGSVTTNNVTINPNGANIAGASQDFIIDADNYQVDLVYNNATRGWEF